MSISSPSRRPHQRKAHPRAPEPSLSRARHLRRRGNARPASTPSSAGTSIRSTAPPTSPTASRSSVSSMGLEQRHSGLKPDEDGVLRCRQSSTIPRATSSLPPSAAKAHGSTASPCTFRPRPSWVNLSSPPAFPSRKRHARPEPSTSTRSSPCAPTAYAAPAPPRSTSPTSPAGRMEAFWEFNLNPWDNRRGHPPRRRSRRPRH